MARNRTPSNILQLRGAYKMHPERKRDEEPVAFEFKKTPPSHLGAEQKKVWRELVRDLAPGTLQSSDRVTLEIAAVLIEEMRFHQESFPSSRYQTLITVLSKLGMSPADRSKVVVPKTKSNKFDKSARTSE